jgi:hypothetical protein
MHADNLARLLGVPDLGAKLGDVERCLEHALDSPTALAAPSRRVTDAGGKRLRPALTIACAGLGGIYDQRVVAAAAAAELVQIGSLVHDDLLNGALTRRGTPIINAVEGASTALLARDFMLAQAGQLAASVGAGAASILATTIIELGIGQTREVALAEPDVIVHQLTAIPPAVNMRRLRSRVRAHQPPSHRGHRPPAVGGQGAGRQAVRRPEQRRRAVCAHRWPDQAGGRSAR